MSALTKSPLARALLVALIVTTLTTAAFAGGPIYTFDYENRIPYTWSMASWPGGQVPVYTDLGNLGVLSNLRVNQMVAFSAAQWSTVPTSTFRATVAGNFSARGLGDINSTNIQSIIGTWNGGGIDVVYDSDGSILTNFFGLPPTAVLGITNLDYTNVGTPEILEAWMVLSGPGIHANDPNGVGFQGVVTHEMGHALNLAHSQMNGAIGNGSVLDAPQPAGCAAPYSTMPNVTTVETMYPISTPEPGQGGEYMGTVDRIDDRAALSDLYPAAGYPGNRGTIQGQILDASGNPVIGVNVIARNVAYPFDDCNSYISGQVSKGFDGPDGTFKLNDLTPGARYVLYVDNLEVGAFSVPRMPVLPGPEEFFNGGMEGTDSAVDDRCDWTTLDVELGSPVNAEIKFQKYAGAPDLMISPNNMVPTDMTPDGSIVVGGYTQYDQVVRWDLNTGAFDELGGRYDTSVSISDDGTTIAANYLEQDGISYPAIHTDLSGWTTLTPVTGAVPCNNSPAGPNFGSAFDISGDGNTVVGLSYGNQGCGGASTRGFKWTATGGTVQLPKVNSLLTAGRANAVNYDGSVIVGWDQASTGYRRAVVWKTGSPTTLILYNGNWAGEALDVTRDGLWIVGAAGNTQGKPWRYNTSTHAVDLLGNLGGTYDGGAATSIDDDNSVITGYSTDSFNGFLTSAIWTQQLHWSNFNTFLNAQGINTAGMAIGNATAQSADGRTLVGVANSRFGYVGFAVKTATSIVCHVAGGVPQTITVSFPQGLDSAIQAGDTLGPCPCSAAVPAGIPALTFGTPVSGTSPLNWTSVSGATGYDIARGSLSVLRATQGDFSVASTDCLESALRANTYADTDNPAVGDGYWYLVRAASCGGHGTYDSGAPSQVGSRDAGMQASTAVCP